MLACQRCGSKSSIPEGPWTRQIESGQRWVTVRALQEASALQPSGEATIGYVLYEQRFRLRGAVCCRGCSAACFSRSCGRPSTRDGCASSTALRRYRIPTHSPATWPPSPMPSGSSMPRPPSVDLKRCWYLGRYTHRVAISNNRLIDFADGRVACHLSAHRSQFVFGAMEPVDFRRNGATAFPAYWSHLS